MTATAETVRELQRRPDLLEITHRLNELAADEAARRQCFRDELAPGDKHEFINGEVLMASPAKFTHIRTIERLGNLLGAHVESRQLGVIMRENALCGFDRNDYQPDLGFWPEIFVTTCEPDQSVFPPPLFAVEVLSPSTATRDRDIKFTDYAAHGVREYWIVDPDARTIEQYLSDDREPYRLLRKLDAGTLKSDVIDGFAIDVESVFASQ